MRNNTVQHNDNTINNIVAYIVSLEYSRPHNVHLVDKVLLIALCHKNSSLELAMGDSLWKYFQAHSLKSCDQGMDKEFIV